MLEEGDETRREEMRTERRGLIYRLGPSLALDSLLLDLHYIRMAEDKSGVYSKLRNFALMGLAIPDSSNYRHRLALRRMEYS